MNEYSVNVCFEDKKIHTKLSELVQNDYNSTKLKFTFDKIGRSVLFKLKNETETVLVDEIENNELILGPGVLNKSGYYEYEISLYGDNSKLTGYVIGQMYVRAELISTDEIVEPDDNKKGCKSSLSLVFALPSLITLSGVLVLKKKEER